MPSNQPIFEVKCSKSKGWLITLNNEVSMIKDRAEKARMLYRSGDMSFEDVKQVVGPYTTAVERRSKELAKKYGMRPQRFNLKAWLR